MRELEGMGVGWTVVLMENVDTGPTYRSQRSREFSRVQSSFGRHRWILGRMHVAIELRTIYR
jgi:hypothetical protein